MNRRGKDEKKEVERDENMGNEKKKNINLIFHVKQMGTWDAAKVVLVDC